MKYRRPILEPILVRRARPRITLADLAASALTVFTVIGAWYLIYRLFLYAKTTLEVTLAGVFAL